MRPLFLFGCFLGPRALAAPWVWGRLGFWPSSPCDKALGPRGRTDALPLLELLLDAAPEQVAGSFMAAALHHYADLLAPVTRTQSLSGASLVSLLKVIPAA